MKYLLQRCKKRPARSRDRKYFDVFYVFINLWRLNISQYRYRGLVGVTACLIWQR